jgi:hypothetical protein
MAAANRISASMGFHRKISVQALVWLAALMLPAQAIPAACSCGDHASQSASATAPGSAAVPSCPHCRAKNAAHACCKGKAGAGHTCCGGGANCRCCCGKGGTGCQGNECHCVHSNPRPAPESTPSPAPTNTAKSPLSTPALGNVSAVLFFTAQAAFTAAHEHPTLLVSSALDRLTALCRLVI